MTKKQRIAELERRVKELEETVFLLQAKMETQDIYRWPYVCPKPYESTREDGTGGGFWTTDNTHIVLCDAQPDMDYHLSMSSKGV